MSDAGRDDLMAFDNFTGDGPLASRANWTQVAGTGGIETSGGVLRATQDVTDFLAYYRTDVPVSSNEQAQITIVDYRDDIGVGVHIQPDGDGVYLVATRCLISAVLKLYKRVSGVVTLMTNFSTTVLVNDGDVISLKVCRGTITAFVNGTPYVAPSSPFTSGRVGVGWQPNGLSIVWDGPFDGDALTVVENFDGLSAASLNGQNGWVTSTAFTNSCTVAPTSVTYMSGNAAESLFQSANNKADEAQLADADASMLAHYASAGFAYLGLRVQPNGDGIYMVTAQGGAVFVAKYVAANPVFTGPQLEFLSNDIRSIGMRIKQIDATHAAVICYRGTEPQGDCSGVTIVEDDGTPGTVGILTIEASVDVIRYQAYTGTGVLVGSGDSYSDTHGFLCGNEVVAFSGVEFGSD